MTELTPFVTSIVMNNDIICRLNFSSIATLRSEVLSCIARCKVNKMFVMKAVFKDVEESELLYSKEETPNSAFQQLVQKFEVSSV